MPGEPFCLQLAVQGPDLYLGFSLISLICALVLQFDLYLGFANMAWIKHAKPRYRSRKSRKTQGIDHPIPADLYLGFSLISLICTWVFLRNPVKSFRRALIPPIKQNLGTDQGNQRKYKVQIRRHEMICTLPFSLFSCSVPCFSFEILRKGFENLASASFEAPHLEELNFDD